MARPSSVPDDERPVDVSAPSALGRPRDPAIDAAVLDAARELLLEVGYGGLSFDLIARRANVGRPAIYRRWPTKVQLVFDAVYPPAVPQSVGDIHDTGDLRADLLDFTQRSAAMMSRPITRAALPGMLAEFHDDPSVLNPIFARSWSLTRAGFDRRIKAGVERGEVVKGTNPDLVLEAVMGGVIFHVVHLQQPVKSFAKSLVDFVLRALVPD